VSASYHVSIGLVLRRKVRVLFSHRKFRDHFTAAQA